MSIIHKQKVGKWVKRLLIPLILASLFTACKGAEHAVPNSTSSISQQASNPDTVSSNTPSNNNTNDTPSDNVINTNITTHQTGTESDNLRPFEIIMEEGSVEKEHAQFKLDSNQYVVEYYEKQGDVYTYYLYAIYQYPSEDEEAGYVGTNLVIYQGVEYLTSIYIEKPENNYGCPNTSEMLEEQDVTFDGISELVVWACDYRYSRAYRCFLINDGVFIECPNYINIPSPTIREDRVIECSEVIDSQYTGYYLYQFDGQDFACVYKTKLEYEEPDWIVVEEEYYNGYQGAGFIGF